MPEAGQNDSNSNNYNNHINNNLMNTAEWLRQARKEAGLTQAELAELAGIRKATISRIENSNGYHSTTINKIKKALRIID